MSVGAAGSAGRNNGGSAGAGASRGGNGPGSAGGNNGAADTGNNSSDAGKASGAETGGSSTDTSTDNGGTTTDASTDTNDKSVSTDSIDAASSPEAEAEEAAAADKASSIASAMEASDEANSATEAAVSEAEAAVEAAQEEDATAEDVAEAQESGNAAKDAAGKGTKAAESIANARGARGRTGHVGGNRGKSTNTNDGVVGSMARGVATTGNAVSSVLGAQDVMSGKLGGLGLAATSTGVVADTAAMVEHGVASTKNSSVAQSLASKAGTLGNVANGIAKTAGPLGIAAMTADGLNKAANGKTTVDRVAGVATTTAGVTTGLAAAPALAGMKAAARAVPIGGAAMTGIEGVSQLAQAQTTQDYVAGSLKTGAAAAFAAAAIPGPHSPVAAAVGTAAYVGAVAADNWDTTKAIAGVVADTIGSGAAWAGDQVSDAVGGIVSGIGGWFD